MKNRSVKQIGIALCLAPFVLALFWFHCRPVVALHYSDQARESIGFFFNDNHNTAKQGLEPGESVVFPTAMFPDSGMWILLTFPFDSKDSLEITKPFSRIDVCIGPGAKIDRTEIRHGFFARFTEPPIPCRISDSGRWGLGFCAVVIEDAT